MTDTEKLGAELGEEFARESLQGSAQDQEAKRLVDVIVARAPRIKLPRLLANERIKAWQQETSVSDAQLKRALTQARAEQKAKAEPALIRVPVQARKRVSVKGSSDARTQAVRVSDLEGVRRGVVPNQDLALL